MRLLLLDGRCSIRRFKELLVVLVSIEQVFRDIDAHLDNSSFKKAEQLCRRVIKILESRDGTLASINRFREKLITMLTDEYKDGEDLEHIIGEFNTHFTNQLKTGDKQSAAQTLNRMCDFLRDSDLRRAISVAEKLIDLFYNSTESPVVDEVYEAHLFLYEKLPPGEGFADFCVCFGEFLEQEHVSTDKACEMLTELAFVLDGEFSDTLLFIFRSFLRRRLLDLTRSQEVQIRDRIGALFLYNGMFEDAISELAWLIAHGSPESVPDYMLWAGEAYASLARKDVGEMYFREVIRALSDSPEDTRYTAAQTMLKRVSK